MLATGISCVSINPGPNDRDTHHGFIDRMETWDMKAKKIPRIISAQEDANNALSLIFPHVYPVHPFIAGRSLHHLNLAVQRPMISP